LDKIAENSKIVADYSRLSSRNITKSFVLGIFSALGATVGVAAVISILTGIIKLFGGIPVIGNLLVFLGQYLRN